MNLLTVSQVAERLATSPMTIHRLIGSKRLVAVNISTGRKKAHWRIEESEIERFLNLRKPAPEPERKRREKKPSGVIEYF